MMTSHFDDYQRLVLIYYKDSIKLEKAAFIAAFCYLQFLTLYLQRQFIV